jgi:hypothetical protein
MRHPLYESLTSAMLNAGRRAYPRLCAMCELTAYRRTCTDAQLARNHARRDRWIRKLERRAHPRRRQNPSSG